VLKIKVVINKLMMKLVLTLFIASVCIAQRHYTSQELDASQRRNSDGTLKLKIIDDRETFVSEYVESQLNLEYSSCSMAFNDVLRWCIVLFGDWYGNRGGNSLMYYMNYLLTTKIPKWVSLCIETTDLN
jgi:hypothetical protein